MTDQAPDPVDVIAEEIANVWHLLAPDAARELSRRLEARGLRVVPVVDGDARAELLERVHQDVVSQQLGWITRGDGEVHPAFDAHADHIYAGDCAVCRCGDRPAALDVVIAAVATAAGI